VLGKAVALRRYQEQTGQTRDQYTMRHTMSKEQRSNKEAKKKPALNAKEKKAAKKAKSAGKPDVFGNL
jgi:sortase (surface protein transpeptidase)